MRRCAWYVLRVLLGDGVGRVYAPTNVRMRCVSCVMQPGDTPDDLRRSLLLAFKSLAQFSGTWLL